MSDFVIPTMLRSSDEVGTEEWVLRTIAQGVARARGEAFFPSVVLSLSKALGVHYALVGELVSEEPERIRTVALAVDGVLVSNMEYALRGTPCEGVMGKRTCVFPEGVRERFPEDEELALLGVEAYLGTPLFDSHGAVRGIMVVMHREPISNPGAARSALEIFAARAGAELERLRSEALLGVSQARTGVGTWVVDMDSGSGYWSPEMYRLYRRPEESGFPSLDEFLDLVHPEDRKVVLETHERAMGRPEPVTAEIRTNPERGPIRHLHTLLQWDPGQGGASGRLAGNTMDVTERRSLEKQLAQAQKMEAVGRLAGGVAHDFNNLLTVIMGEAEHARMHVAEDGPADESMRAILDASRRAAGLTRQLLQFSRVDALDRTTFDLNQVVEGTVQILERVLGERICLELRPSPGALVVIGDERRLEQVLINLAVNARDSMADGGLIRIDTAALALGAQGAAARQVEPGPYALLRVSDSGSGIPEDIRDHLFEPFFTTKAPGKGSGLGLSTSYGIVKQHGGFIEVDSRPGHGTTFSVAIPLQAAETTG